jgi:hypothetical protein
MLCNTHCHRRSFATSLLVMNALCSNTTTAGLGLLVHAQIGQHFMTRQVRTTVLLGTGGTSLGTILQFAKPP